MDHATSHDTAEAASYWRRLLHRWLIEYNPLYLISATLVLGGMILTSRGLAREGSLYGEIGVAAISELYAAALIGGAALLTRLGHRRPAVMLGLLTALYQCDLTLHTETCAFLGAVGVWAAAGWLGLFVAKLYAIAWALKLRLSRLTIATATLGALGLTVFPHYLQSMDARASSSLVAIWLFALGSLVVSQQITSSVDLDAWGATVLRRAVRATWVMWAALLFLHVLFWSKIQVEVLLPVAALLLIRRIRSEAQVWAVVAGTLVLVGVASPGYLSVAALLAMAALALRAVPVTDAVRLAPASDPPVTSSPSPYRAFSSEVEAPRAVAPAPLVPFAPEARLRLMTGALFALYLSVWTLGWTRGPWPNHILALDLSMTVLVVLIAWRARVRSAIVPMTACYAHLVVQLRVIPAPRSLLQWGGTAVGLGFALLFVALGATYWLRRSADVTDRSPREAD